VSLGAVAGALEITSPKGSKFYARPVGSGVCEEVRSPALTVRLTFAGNDSSMTLTLLNVNTGETEPPLQRWVPVRPAAAALRSYPGVYVGDDVEVTLYITVSGDDVVMAARGLSATRLEPTPVPDQFAMTDYHVAFHCDEAGKVTHLTLDASRVKAMRFKRSDGR
jgi:hypothetical protein